MNDRLRFAEAKLAEVEQYISPGSPALASLLISALLKRNCTTGEAMWAVYRRVKTGRYAAFSLRFRPPHLGYIASNSSPPAGLELADGVLHIDARGSKGKWSECILVLTQQTAPKADAPGQSITLGRLWAILQSDEEAYAANSKKAEHHESKGSAEAAWWRLQAAAVRFQPNPVEMPGIDRIQLLCDELGDGKGLTAANVAKLRAKVCRAKACSLEEANELSLDETAEAAEGVNLQQSDQGQSSDLMRKKVSEIRSVQAEMRERERLLALRFAEAFGKQIAGYADSLTWAALGKEAGVSELSGGASLVEREEIVAILIGQSKQQKALQESDSNQVPEQSQNAIPNVPKAEFQPHAIALLSIFTNGISDDRILQATNLLGRTGLTANEKLMKINTLLPFPATASAQQLADMLRVSKAAVIKTDWWTQNRKGEKQDEIGRRRSVQENRSEVYEDPDRLEGEER